MSNYTPRAQMIFAVLVVIATIAGCSFIDNPVASMIIMGVCGVLGLIVLAYGYIGPVPAKKKGLSEEEEAQDAVAGAMFMDGDDLF